MQSAPAAPDPTGLAAAMQLLGTPNLFKDITGLEGTQRNALEAFKGAMETAQFFGGKASDMALQAKMAKDIDKSMRTIKAAKDSGLITDKQAEESDAKRHPRHDRRRHGSPGQAHDHRRSDQVGQYRRQERRCHQRQPAGRRKGIGGCPAKNRLD